jgi:signal transduction histidine kinase/GAF domain-containing protein
LAELVLRKTGGNPFFANEFLKTLYTENLLTFDFEHLSWRWDIAHIEGKGITDNVVELMLGKLKKLPPATQQVLRFAACVGADFDLSTLSIICESSPSEIFPELVTAIQSGLIVPMSELDEQLLVQNYKFLHDRVQQAAYTLIDESQKHLVHLQIGRLLLQNTTSDLLTEKIFEIVDHLNFGVELVTHQQERDEIVKLNLMAGQKALAATAYDAALQYFKVGLKLLKTESWQSEYNLTLALYSQAAEAAYLSGHFDEMEQLVDVVLNHASTVLDQVKAYDSRIQACLSQGDPKEALKIGLEVLKLLGVIVVETPSQLDVQRGLEETASLLAGREIEGLIELPEMTEPEPLAAIYILGSIGGAAFMVSPVLMVLIMCKMVNLSLNNGNATWSPLGYAAYGLIQCGVVQDIELGYKFGKLALSLVERLNNKKGNAKAFLVLGSHVMHWKEHLRETLPILVDGYQSAVETGDFEFAGYCAFNLCYYSYFVGQELTELEQKTALYSKATSQIRRENPFNWLAILRQTILNLLGQSENPSRLIGCVYNEEQALSRAIAVKDGTGIHHFYLNKLILCYLFGEYHQAAQTAFLAEQYLGEVTALISVPLFHFYDSLVLLSVLANASISEKEAWLNRVNINQEKIQKWAHHAPMNYLHKFHLVEAEKARVLGQVLEAEEFYERAISGASDNGYLQEEALAYELAAKFHLFRGREKFAQTYMKEAHYCYGRWGALAKVRDLEAKYPQLLTQSPTVTRTIDTGTTNSTTTTGNSLGSSLDLATVMKASQAISSEIVLDKLLASLMKILIENAGAQKGFLILETQGKLLIEASGTVEQEQVAVLQSIPIDSGDVSTAIANYVARTKESVVLNNASREGRFTNDPYIQAHQPKSILCAPLINQGKLVSIVYLENNLTTEAFTPDRLEVLKLLSSQAAISIDLAKLYAEVRANENRLTQFLEAMPVGVAILNANGKPCFTNVVTEQLLGKTLVPPATMEQLPEVYQLYLAGTNQLYPREQIPMVRALRGECSAVDDMEIHQGNNIIPIETRGTPIFDENGNIAYAIAAFQDITKRRQAEIAKSTFIAQMSHELRTPLNAILGFAQLMGNSSYLPPEHQENLNVIARSGEHLLALINQVLDLSKIEAGQMTLNEANFNLYRLLNDLENMFQLKANNKGLHLLFERTVEVSQYVRTDEVKLRQVLINLLSNAIKFTKTGSVSLKVKSNNKQQTTITFEIENTGVGIASDELDSIFKAFVQIKADRKFQEGTGLGLTIARSFVQLMGGNISVNSQVGKGTVFKFDITVSTVEPVDINSQQLISRTLAPEFSQQNRLSSADVLTPAALADLSPDLVANLHQAILALDIERIKTCIAQIHEVNAPVAEVIAILAKGYKYKQLLALMQPATD